MKPFYVKPAPLGSNSYHVMRFGKLNPQGLPWCEAAFLTYEQALALAEEKNAKYNEQRALKAPIWVLGWARRGRSELIPAGVRSPWEFFRFDRPVFLGECTYRFYQTEINIEHSRETLIRLMREQPLGWRSRLLQEREYLDAALLLRQWLRDQIYKWSPK